MENQPNHFSRISETFRSADIFPLNVGFTHKKIRTYKSASSGVFSILTLLLVIAYFLYLASDIWNFKVSLKNSLSKRDLIFDNTSFDLTDYDFYAALNLQYIGPNKTVIGNLHQYVSINFNQVTGFWNDTDEGSLFVIDVNNIDTEKCREDAFNNDTEYLEKLNIVGNYYCPVSKNFRLQGSMSSDTFAFLSINVRECNQTQLEQFQPGEVCAPLEEQQEVASYLLYSYILTNQYFSGENREEPIQQDYKLLTLGVPYKQAFYTVNKLSISYAILEDSWLFESYDSRNISYSTSRIDTQYGRPQMPYSPNTPFMTVIVLLDEDVYVNERTAFNMVAALQSLGGFASVVMMGSRIIFNFAQQFNYFSEIVSLLYLEEENVEKEKFPDDDQFSAVRDDHSHSQRGLYQKSSRLRDQQQSPDIERSLSKASKLINRLSDQYFSTKSPKINFCTFLSLYFRKGTKSAQVFKQSREKLQLELNLEQFIKKMRMLEFYLEVKLNSFQKTILKSMSQRISISTSEQNEEIPMVLDPDPQSFKHSMYNLIEASQSEDCSKFDQKLAAYLGLQRDFRQPENGPRYGKKARRKGPVKDKYLVSAKGAQVAFKKVQKGIKGYTLGKSPKMKKHIIEEEKQDFTENDSERQ